MPDIKKTPALLHDEAFAMQLARQECAAAGMGHPDALTDDFVRASQNDRLQHLQALPAPRPPVPAKPQSLDAHHAWAEPPVIGRTLSIDAAKFEHKFNGVGGPTAEETQASQLRAPKLRAALNTHYQMVEVRGDGNCGYYALLAGVTRAAVNHPGLRKTVTDNLKALAHTDHTAALAIVAGDPAHDLPHQASGAQALGKSTLARIAGFLDSSRPQDALSFIEDPRNEETLKAAHYILRAKATGLDPDPDTNIPAG